MTASDDRRFPSPLTAVARITFDLDDGIDYEPFDAFLSAEETTDWLRAWTGNAELDGDEFRVFGQDGSGGYVALWLARADAALMDQPVVFLGSEGGTGVIARNLADYLWLLADGYGPWEAAEGEEPAEHPNPELSAIAEQHAPGARRPGTEIIAAAGQEFPDFERTMTALCR